MKKKVLTTLSVVLILGLAALGILAYLTDQDSDVNVMTLGNVQIDLIEEQRADDGQSLVDFEQNKELTPLVGSAQGEKDQFGMPVASNYVDKIVSVKNTGDSDAYVRVLVAVPAALEDSGALHWNLGNKFDPNGQYFASHENPDYADTTLTESEDVVLEGIEYNTYVFTYQKPLAKDEVVDGIFVGFYLDSAVDYDGENYTINGTVVDYDISKGVKIPVLAQAVQEAGFDGAVNALNAGFGEATEANATEWFYVALGYVKVATKDELINVIKDGGNVRLTEDVQMNDGLTTIEIADGEEANINLNGNDLTASLGMIPLSGEDTVLNIVGTTGSEKVENIIIGVDNGATVNVENVVLDTASINEIPIVMNEGTVNLVNTTLNIPSGIAVYLQDAKDCVFNMNGGKIIAQHGIFIHSAKSEVTINLNAGSIEATQDGVRNNDKKSFNLNIADAFSINGGNKDINSFSEFVLNGITKAKGEYAW